MKWRGLLGLLTSLCSLNLGVHAEGNCPAGQYPIGNGAVAACAPIPGVAESRAPVFNHGTSSRTAEHWEDRWGAVATDATRGVLGAATGIATEQAAEQIALAACKAKGGRQCKLGLAYRNGCVVLTTTGSSYNIAARDTTEMAIAAGKEECVNAGGQTCETFYDACSLPQLVRD